MRDHKKLQVWQKAHQLTLAIYRITKSFPADELYGLTSQMRRSASSIPANLAEGCGRAFEGDLARFVQIAMGSAAELEYHLLLANDLGYLNPEDYQVTNTDLTEIRRMLTSFHQAVKHPKS